jgi:hypothetical protein
MVLERLILIAGLVSVARIAAVTTIGTGLLEIEIQLIQPSSAPSEHS